jgi:hypothetical protein
MAYHLYVKPSGFADVSEYPLSLDVFPDYAYLGEFPTMPDVGGKRYVDGAWVRGSKVPEHVERRQRAYPKLDELIQALWHAMDQGILPKVPGFYDKIDEANKRFPEQ